MANPPTELKILSWIDPDRARYTRAEFWDMLVVCGQSKNPILQDYNVFIGVIVKLAKNQSYNEVAYHMDIGGMEGMSGSYWENAIPKYLNEWARSMSALLNPEERWCSEPRRGQRSLFQRCTMMVGSFPTYTVGGNGISTTVLCDWYGVPLAVISGHRPEKSDGEKLAALGDICHIDHYDWETILADGAYTASEHCVCPWGAQPSEIKDDPKMAALKRDDILEYRQVKQSADLSYPQQRFNAEIAIRRSRVEHFFSRMYSRWRFTRGCNLSKGVCSKAMTFAVQVEKYASFGMRTPKPRDWEGVRANADFGGRQNCKCTFGRVSDSILRAEKRATMALGVKHGYITKKAKRARVGKKS